MFPEIDNSRFHVKRGGMWRHYRYIRMTAAWRQEMVSGADEITAPHYLTPDGRSPMGYSIMFPRPLPIDAACRAVQHYHPQASSWAYSNA